MAKTLDFQSIMLTLEHFWADQGCLIWQPYYSQVGAGTNNPATFLRVLGPEPWNVAYVEPSVRPDDGRFGENPNRLQQHYQFQVILKPDPGNPQELYLQSLQAIGIDPRQHDIRFVEDNWESPALGAWGLGWEVWLDGQEITQFTYFQQAGGTSLDPVAVEITYGLERITMALQNVRHFREIRWSPELTYGDVNFKAEQEHSRYYFEAADVGRLRQMYNLYEAEARSALERGLVLPGYDYLLKCSHTFNVLDSRGAVGVTERQSLFSSMRELARQAAAAYVEQRQRLEFPWLKENNGSPLAGAATRIKTAAQNSRPVEFTTPKEPGASPQEFLFEIGTEELPAADLKSGLAQLQERVPVLLNELHLAHGEVRILGTPRRLVISVVELAARQADRTTVFKGPPASRAFDALGQPTKAAEGFAKSRGVGVKDLEVREIDGGQYIAAVVQETGRLAVDVLAETLPKLVASIRFDKAMRWNTSNVAFSRPIRWLLALFGGEVVPFAYAGLSSGSATRGLRFHPPAEIEVHSQADYFTALAGQGILIDPALRRKAIAEQVLKLMVEAGGIAKLDDDLLDEVTQLVEAPTALLGHFDPSHLQLPSEVLVSVMKKHQRYFPVQAANGRLLPCFITVRNGDGQSLKAVADGNEQVIRARYADAAFFINQDLQHKLEDYLPRLGTLIFQTKLGSMLDKSQRIERLVERLLPVVPVEDDAAARRAAHLCKADLVTHMVIEMTSLQGIMGRYYARHSGESDAVAEAIYEHYLPRSTGDEAPHSRIALLVSLADRLDTLAGLFAAGLAPTGTKDPFAQRRAALGLVQALAAWNLDFDLRAGIALASENLPVPSSPEIQSACLDFIAGRMRSLLVDLEGKRYDVVDAVLAVQRHNPAGVAQGVKDLGAWVSHADWATILPAYSRCVRITPKLPGVTPKLPGVTPKLPGVTPKLPGVTPKLPGVTPKLPGVTPKLPGVTPKLPGVARDKMERHTVNPEVLVEPAEKDLLLAIEKAEACPRRPGSVEDFLQAFLPMIPAINSFFNLVMVMAEDPVLRSSRLGMLQRIVSLAQGCADLSYLEGF